MGDETMEHKVTLHMTVEVPANGPAVPGYALKPASTDTAAAMADFVVPVPAGVMELMERPEQGYCYIKP